MSLSVCRVEESFCIQFHVFEANKVMMEWYLKDKRYN